MNPTIQVDHDVYDLLKKRAEPFVETSPNLVLRRLLGLATENGSESSAGPDDGPAAASIEEPSKRKPSVRRGKRRRAPRGSVLPSTEYELPILQALAKKGGRAASREAIDAVGERLDDRFTELDRERVNSGEIRWRNRTQFVRLALIKERDMKSDSPRGVWELTEKGARRARGGGR